MSLKDLYSDDFSSNEISEKVYNHLSGISKDITILNTSCDEIPSNIIVNRHSESSENSKKEVIGEPLVKNDLKSLTSNKDINIDFEFEEPNKSDSVIIDFKFEKEKIEENEIISFENINAIKKAEEIIDFSFSEEINKQLEEKIEITPEVEVEIETVLTIQNDDFQKYENEKYVEKILAAKKMLELNFEVSKIEDITGINLSEINDYIEFLNSKNAIIENESNITQIKNEDSTIIKNSISEMQNQVDEVHLKKENISETQNSQEVYNQTEPNTNSSNSFFGWLNELNQKDTKEIEDKSEDKHIEKISENTPIESHEKLENVIELEQQVHINEIEYQDFDDKVNDFINSQIESRKKESKNISKKNTLNEIPETSDFLSETLADLYLRQGLKDKAKLLYEKLIQQFPEKSAYFADKIKNCN